MSWLKTITRELVGLFVEDPRFTATLVAWIAITAAARPWWRTAGPLGALVLFAGFAVILCESVRRAARRE